MIATNFRIFITPYDTLLHSPSGKLIHSSNTLALQFKTTVWRVRTLAKVKVEAETVEMVRASAKVKAREKVDISRLSDEAREKTEFDSRARKNDNVVNMAAVEAAAKIRFSAEIQ